MVGVGSALLEGGRSKLLLLFLCLCQRYHDYPDLMIERTEDFLLLVCMWVFLQGSGKAWMGCDRIDTTLVLIWNGKA